MTNRLPAPGRGTPKGSGVRAGSRLASYSASGGVGRRLRADHHRRQWGRQQRWPGHHAEGGGAPVGRPAIYWAGWGLFAVGALLALMLIALYVRFTPGFNRQKRLEEEGGSPASHCQQGSPLRA